MFEYSVRTNIDRPIHMVFTCWLYLPNFGSTSFVRLPSVALGQTTTTIFVLPTTATSLDTTREKLFYLLQQSCRNSMYGVVRAATAISLFTFTSLGFQRLPPGVHVPPTAFFPPGNLVVALIVDCCRRLGFHVVGVFSGVSFPLRRYLGYWAVGAVRRGE